MTLLQIFVLAGVFVVVASIMLVRQLSSPKSQPRSDHNTTRQQRLDRAHETNNRLGQELVDSEARVAEVSQQLSDSVAALEEAEAQLLEAQKQLETTKRKLEDTQLESRDAHRNVNSTRHELVRTKTKLDSALNRLHAKPTATQTKKPVLALQQTGSPSSRPSTPIQVMCHVEREQKRSQLAGGRACPLVIHDQRSNGFTVWTDTARRDGASQTGDFAAVLGSEHAPKTPLDASWSNRNGCWEISTVERLGETIRALTASTSEVFLVSISPTVTLCDHARLPASVWPYSQCSCGGKNHDWDPSWPKLRQVGWRLLSDDAIEKQFIIRPADSTN